MSWIKRVFARRRLYRDLSEEMREHLEEKIEDLVAGGMSREEATRTARREFGNVTLLEERSREVWQWPPIESLFLDVRYGLRSLTKTPSFTILAIAILALGIGANTAIFSVVNAVLLRPLPYPDPARLVAVTTQLVAAPATLVTLRNGSRLVEYAGYTQNSEVNLTGQGEPARIVASEVSANLFRVLGVRPLMGGDFGDGEDLAGHGHAVLLSYGLWKTRFHSDPNVLGRSAVIDDGVKEIVGVMPPDFQFPSPSTELWIPIQIDPSNVSAYYYMANLPLVGRLRPGASLSEARAEFGVLIAPLKAKLQQGLPNWGNDASLDDLQSVMVSGTRGYLLLLLGAVGLVLLIACANFANLLVVRNIVRRKELAVRAALGASRVRILQQVLIESLVVALAGGALGLALSRVGTGILGAHLLSSIPRLAEVSTDSRVFGFTSLLSILTGLGFGLIPALGATKLNGGSIGLTERTSTGSRRHVLAAFVVVEIAVAVVVVMGAGLLGKSVWLLSGRNPGFDAGHVLTLQVTPPRSVCLTHERCVEFYRQLLERVRALPGVTSASAVSALPLSGYWRFAAELEGHAWLPGTPVTLIWNWQATPDYLRTMRIPLLQGREFTESDSETGEPVVIISAATAKRYWPGQNPLGKHLRGIWEKQWRRVIGIVGDVHNTTLGVDPSATEGQAYFPYANPIQAVTGMTLAIRTASDPLESIAPVRTAVAEVNADVPISHIQTMKEVVENSFAEPRSMTWLLVSFAALALLLGAVGIYGVISYAVTQRVREIGIRVALGAVPFDIRSLILGQSLRQVAVGLVIGVPVALAATRVLQRQLFEVSTADPLTYLAGSLLVACAALLAAWVPSNRAVRLDPASAVREE
jgi:predicted permease